MSLRDALKKAAGLVIEFDPDQNETPVDSTPATTVTVGSSTDRMWDELESSTRRNAAEAPSLQSETPAAPPPSPAAPSRTVEQIVREAAGPNLDQINVGSGDLPDVIGPDGSPNFAPLYTRAGLPPVSYSSEQMLDMLTSLPAELPLAVKRQTVNAMLKGIGTSIGASPETIVADASRKIAALAAYVDTSAHQADGDARKLLLEIQDYEAKIAEHKRTIETSQAKQTQISQVCSTQAAQLHQVLEFFSRDESAAKAPSV